MFVGGGMPLCVPKDAKNPMGGFKYITYFRCTMDGVAFSRDNFGDVADIKEAYEDPAFHTTPQDMRDYFQCDVLEQYAKYSLAAESFSASKDTGITAFFMMLTSHFHLGLCHIDRWVFLFV